MIAVAVTLAALLLHSACPRPIVDLAAEVNQHQFVFVVGAYRSGTLLVKELLSQHPDVSTMNNINDFTTEGQYGQFVYPVCRTILRSSDQVLTDNSIDRLWTRSARGSISRDIPGRTCTKATTL